MRAKILIVDDSSSDRQIIKSVLHEFDILTANNGVEAMKAIQQHEDIDLIILDLNMPVMNGFDVLYAIQTDYVHRKIRTIILTNYDEIENEIKGLKAGAVDYIRKPIHMESFKVRIEVHVQLLQIQKSIEQKYKEQSFTFDTIFYEAPIGIAISFNDKQISSNLNNFLRINPMFEKITGYTKDELELLGWATITHPDDLEEDLMNYQKLQNNEINEYFMDKRFVKPDGTIVWTYMVVAKIKLLKDFQHNHICLIQDITRRKKAEDKLKESERSKSVLLSHLPGLAYRCNFDHDWTMKYVSDGCLELTGYPSESFINNNILSFNDIIASEYREALFDKWMDVVSNDETFSYEYEIITASKDRKWVLEIGQSIKNKQGKIEALEGLILDITQRKEMENDLRYNSEHDLETGLHNLNCLMRNLVKDKQMDMKRALIGINVSDMHYLTTTYGFQYTLEIKKKLANALLILNKENTNVFTTYENQFVFYIRGYQDFQEVLDFCNVIIKTLDHELSVERIRGGLGVIEIHKYKNQDENILLKNLLVASEHAIDVYDRDFGIRVFDNELENQIIRKETIKNELSEIARGIKQERLSLYYQPVIDLKTNKVIGFEALSRLFCDEFDFVSPNEFIPILEKTKLIIPLGKRIISQAFLFLNEIEKLGFNDIIVSINISAIQLIRKDFVEMISIMIQEMDVMAKNVIFEMTESIFASNFNEINEVLKNLQQLGIKIALDDFGTGYSSLAREHELNVNTLKIDKQFIDKLMPIDHQQAITGSVIMMAHKLGHNVIAEGVEDEKQLEYLKDNNCDMVQGFYFSKPLTQEKAIDYLINKNN